ncbi:unnamed protein product, partial [Adineta steineri]
FIETISDNTWSNDLQDLSIKAKFESHPLNEGFILLADQTTKSSPIKFKSITSILHNISSTTCQTKTKQLTTTSSSLTRQTPIQDDSDIGNFLQVDEEELNRELLNMDTVMEGSTTEKESTITSESTIISTTTTTRLSTTNSITSVTSSIPMTTTAPEKIILSNTTIFIITLDCSNINSTLQRILEQFRNDFHYSFDGPYINITTVKNVTSCYLIDQCGLCGTNPPRGVCYASDNL